MLVGTATILIVTASLHSTGGSIARHVTVIMMPLTMAPILAACIRLLVSGGHRLPAPWAMAGAAAANLVATVVLTVDPQPSGTGLLLGLWIVAFTLLAVGCAHPSFAVLAAPTAVDPKHWQLGRLARLLIERNAAERALARAALHDPLTGLPNRASLTDALARNLARSARDRTPLSVLFIDLDGFKAVNDSQGHAVGDELLTAVARRLEESVRGGDLATRLAGDEFVVPCPASMLADARSTADRITRSLGTPFPLSCGEVTIGASVGAAQAGPDDDVEGLLHRADAAMYATKAARAGRVDRTAPVPRAMLH